MPTFPPYHGHLPECLSLRNPRHYLLLAYWVYFRPTALKNYLYQADPELYRSGPGLGVFRAWHVSAYRNLYLMTPLVALFLSVLMGLLAVLLAGWWEGAPIDWRNWEAGVAVGVATGVAVGLLLGVTAGLMGSAALGMATGVVAILTGGVALGIANGVLAATNGVVVEMIGSIIHVSVNYAGMVALITGCLGIGLAIGATFSVTIGTMASVILGIFVGIATYRGGAGLGGVILGGAISFGATRMIFYLPQLIPVLWGKFRASKHPINWDEFIILPLPNSSPTLARQLQRDQTSGLHPLMQTAANPFQRWAVQRSLTQILHHQPDPLQFLYNLLIDQSLSTYAIVPASPKGWERIPTTVQLFMGELAGEWVDCGQSLGRFIWSITRPLRYRQQTPLTDLAGLLYHCLDFKNVEAETFNLAEYQDDYTGVADYLHGEEIAQTFAAMCTYLAYSNLFHLPGATTISFDTVETPLRPAVLAALRQFANVGAEVATFQAATSRANQLAALARAADALSDLKPVVEAEVMAPEKYILQRIIKQWQELIIQEGGEVGREEEAGPVPNPYVAGNPVSGSLFVGRQDILRRLEELWAGSGQCPSVVLYGHRRMGKSSILQNLGARFGAQTTVVDFNMQRVGLVANTGELLYNLALALFDAFSTTHLTEPDEEPFLQHNPYTAFGRFLKKLDPLRNGRRFIITVDEFELIEEMVVKGQLEGHLLDYWRSLIQTYPWYIMAFAGLHTLQEMTHNYWHPLFGSVTAIPVSFLQPEAARELIVQPSPDFSLDYDADAIARIIALTHGQPYLMQLIGHGLVSRFNRQMFEEGLERERRFSLADVDAVISSPEFYRDGDAYFTGVWRQAAQGAAGQHAVLKALTTGPATTETLAGPSGLSLAETVAALKTLLRHDVIHRTNTPETAPGIPADNDIAATDEWDFTVELMCRWVAQRKNT